MYHKHPNGDTYYTELGAAQHQKFSILIKQLAFKYISNKFR